MMRRLREDRGQDLVEYAMVFVLLFLLILGVFEFGTLIFTQNSLANVAREGARWGAVRRTDFDPKTFLPAYVGTVEQFCDDGAPNAIVDAACDKALALDRSRLRVTVSQPSANVLTVYVRYTYEPFFAPIGALLPNPLLMDSSSTMRLE